MGITNRGQLVYIKDDMMEILMNRDEMSWDEAEEFFEYNIMGLFSDMPRQHWPVIIERHFIGDDSTDTDNVGQLSLPF